jgi:hypothetical protein
MDLKFVVDGEGNVEDARAALDGELRATPLLRGLVNLGSHGRGPALPSRPGSVEGVVPFIAVAILNQSVLKAALKCVTQWLEKRRQDVSVEIQVANKTIKLTQSNSLSADEAFRLVGKALEIDAGQDARRD